MKTSGLVQFKPGDSRLRGVLTGVLPRRRIDKTGGSEHCSGMKRTLCLFPLAAALLAGGCAYYKIQPVSASSLRNWGKTNGPQEGYVFYQPELYFAAMIATDSTGDKGTAPAKQNVTVTPIYLPNHERPYRVTTHNFLAKADFTFNFENGWKLTQISDKSDNTAVASTLAGELKTMLSAAGVKAMTGAGTNAPKQRVILYRPEYDDEGYIQSFKQAGVMELN
jgi:hypothetical protein